VDVTGCVNFGHVQLNNNTAAGRTVCVLSEHYTKPVLLWQSKENFVRRRTLARSAFSRQIQNFVLTGSSVRACRAWWAARVSMHILFMCRGDPVLCSLYLRMHIFLTGFVV